MTVLCSTVTRRFRDASLGVLVLVWALEPATRAWADVPLPGTQPAEFQDPANGFEVLRPSIVCRICHADFVETPTEPFDGWAGSVMGNAARDPLFLAALSVAEDDQPGIGDFCLRCHAPEAWIEGRATPTDGSALQPNDDGVSCHFCHRLVSEDPMGADPNAPYIGNARSFIAKASRMRGPYSDVTLAQHETIRDSFVEDAAYCGLCHDISNPLVPWRSEDGHELGPEFPLDRTYSEWLRSAFPDEGVTCQSCHMAPVADAWACSVVGAPARTIYRHEFAGGNTWLPRALQTIWGDELRSAAFWRDAVVAASEALSVAAELSFEEAPESVDRGTTLAFAVRVTNLTGHRLPTGYPADRRMWLEVVVTDADGERILESGQYDAATATRLDDEQLRTYEVQLGVAGEGPSFHYSQSDVIVSDTRIPPRGYAPWPDDPGMLPVGRDYPDGAGGIAHWDVAPYQVRVDCSQNGPLRLRAHLLQQTVSREYVEFLRDAPTTPLGRQRGADLYDAWEQTGEDAPESMGEIETTVALDGVCGADDAGAADAGPAGGGAASGCCSTAPGAPDVGRDRPLLCLLLAMIAVALRRRGRYS